MNHKTAPMHQGASLFSPGTLMYSSQLQAQMVSPYGFCFSEASGSKRSFSSLTVHTSWFILAGKLDHLIPYIVKYAQYLNYIYDVEDVTA